MAEKYHTAKGFTLIEILVVAGIIVILGTFTTTSLVNWREHKTLSTTAEQMATMLREAVSNSVQQKEGTDWGIHFDNIDSNKPFYAVFRSGTYSPSTEVARYPLPASVRYDTSMGVQKDCAFSQISGQVADIVQCSGIKIFLVQNPDASSTIEIQETGMIAYSTYACGLFGCSAVSVTTGTPCEHPPCDITPTPPRPGPKKR